MKDLATGEDDGSENINEVVEDLQKTSSLNSKTAVAGLVIGLGRILYAIGAAGYKLLLFVGKHLGIPSAKFVWWCIKILGKGLLFLLGFLAGLGASALAMLGAWALKAGLSVFFGLLSRLAVLAKAGLKRVIKGGFELIFKKFPNSVESILYIIVDSSIENSKKVLDIIDNLRNDSEKLEAFVDRITHLRENKSQQAAENYIENYEV